MKSQSDAIKELERNRQLDCKPFYYLNTQIQLHVTKKFIHVKKAKEAWKFLIISYCDHGGEETCDEEEETKCFDEI